MMERSRSPSVALVDVAAGIVGVKLRSEGASGGRWPAVFNARDLVGVVGGWRSSLSVGMKSPLKAATVLRC